MSKYNEISHTRRHLLQGKMFLLPRISSETAPRKQLRVKFVVEKRTVLKFSTRTRYGLRAMVELANDANGEGIFQKDISVHQDISVKYLDHIIHSLKAAGLITSTKGKKSGYILTRKPSEISIYDIHTALENEICVIECLSSGINCTRMDECSVQPFWKGLNQVVIEYFKNTSLEEIASGKLKVE
ncbi:MAG TPA: Rrf2 family transcriptional regulator [Prolixibacteraceae bacterium]|nr:Rrf2 family transcriptional regulator [Prolixibacteraceae bacterium]